MKKWFSNNKLYLIGAFLGGIAGYFYWQQVGCSSGTCMITSKPLNSTAYGAMMCALLLSMFKKELKQTTLVTTHPPPNHHFIAFFENRIVIHIRHYKLALQAS